MNKKVLYFDIDGTLATHEGIVPSNKEVLQTLRQLGHHVVIASGRPDWYIKQMFNGLLDGLISSNGRHIEYHNEIILDDFLTVHELETIVDICNQVKCGYLLVGKEDMYLGNVQYIKQTHGYEKSPITDFTLDNINIYMFDIFYDTDEHFKEIKKAFEGIAILNDHHVGSADASSLHVNKGTAVTQLTKYLNLDKEDSFAFGDGENDIDMFKAVGHAIAMKNANDFVKSHADDITDSVDKEGIKKALLKYKIL